MHRSVALVGVVAVLAALGCSSVAVAAPDGQRITVIHAVPEGDTAPVSQFYEVAEADAVGTPIGSPTLERHLIAIDVDATGHGYALGTGSPTELKLQLLFRADAAAGTVSDPIHLIFPVGIGQCFELDLLPDGRLLATCEGLDAQSVPTASVVFIDPDQGLLTPIHSEPIGDGGPHYRGIATNPETGWTWVFGELDGAAFGFRLELDGFVWPAVPFDVLPLAADFAELGPDGPQLWAILAFVRREFAAVDPFAGTIRSVAAFDFDATETDDVTALTVWGTPELAATGGAGGPAAPTGVVAAVVLLAGAGLVAVGVRTRRRCS
jgi:hypothetical protein